jgi:hypothetical protein
VGRLREERFEVDLLLDLLPQGFLVVTRQPADDCIQLLLRVPFFSTLAT